MDEHNTELYNANSGFYVLPTKEPPWNCSKALYSLVTISSAITIGLLVGCFSPRGFFNTSSLSTTEQPQWVLTTSFAIFAPFILFCSCLYGCKRFNRKLFSECVTNRFTATDVLYAIQAICISFLKTALIYYLIAILSSPYYLNCDCLDCSQFCFQVFQIVGDKLWHEYKTFSMTLMTIADVAVVWQEQRGSFTDNKIEQFGTNVLRPISDTGARLNLQAEQLSATLKKISGSGVD